MTQIKLRRDTSANFISKNPVLGVGEPAYETDTKKLKIGDGTTAYTQLDYFSAGGGGSTNISATLPLKIVDGVISLEVDGQTIQIVDGKLHANLDELGNEVNSLTGEVTDLSGRVTAAEADLANKASKSDLAAKQDKLSPIAPLGINQTTISNVTNGTFLTDASVTLNSAFYIDYITDDNARFLITASGVSGGATPTSFIQIPFALGDLISFPFEKNSDSNIGLVFGYWKDNLFYPTMLYKTSNYYGSLGSRGYAMFNFVSEAGKSSLEKIATYYGLSSAVSKSALVYHESIPLNATNYIQVTKNAGVPTVNMWFTISGESYPNRGYTQRMYTSDTTVLENFNKTNVCLLLSNDTSKAINLTKVTRRELRDTVLNPTVDDLTTALNTYSNSFDATAKVVTNDLSLAIGSGLAITDGKLTASSTAPSNMVTTDTNQTITGDKTFTGGNTFQEHITIGNTGAGQIDKLKLAALNGSSTATTLYNGLQIYTDIRTYTSTLRVGDVNLPMILQGSTISDNNDKKFLTQGNVTAGDNITITNTSTGIQIAATGAGGGVTPEAYITETYVNGESWYRIYSDGWCEQGGRYRINTNGQGSVSLLKSYRDNTNYHVLLNKISSDASSWNVMLSGVATTSTFNIHANLKGYELGGSWYACGYIES